MLYFIILCYIILYHNRIGYDLIYDTYHIQFNTGLLERIIRELQIIFENAGIFGKLHWLLI